MLYQSYWQRTGENIWLPSIPIKCILSEMIALTFRLNWKLVNFSIKANDFVTMIVILNYLSECKMVSPATLSVLLHFIPSVI